MSPRCVVVRANWLQPLLCQPYGEVTAAVATSRVGDWSYAPAAPRDWPRAAQLRAHSGARELFALLAAPAICEHSARRFKGKK